MLCHLPRGIVFVVLARHASRWSTCGIPASSDAVGIVFLFHDSVVILFAFPCNNKFPSPIASRGCQRRRTICGGEGEVGSSPVGPSHSLYAVIARPEGDIGARIRAGVDCTMGGWKVGGSVVFYRCERWNRTRGVRRRSISLRGVKPGLGTRVPDILDMEPLHPCGVRETVTESWGGAKDFGEKVRLVEPFWGKPYHLEQVTLVSHTHGLRGITRIDTNPFLSVATSADRLPRRVNCSLYFIPHFVCALRCISFTKYSLTKQDWKCVPLCHAGVRQNGFCRISFENRSISPNSLRTIIS